MVKNIINHSSSLLEALDMLNRLPGNAMTLFVVDDNNHLVGTLTDGDIRRGLLNGLSLEATAKEAACDKFKAITTNCSNQVEFLRQCRASGIKMVPILNADGSIAEIIDLNTTRTRLPLSAILMAGGKGERLRPMTLTTPKPLLKIEGKAIIDYNIEALAHVGIKNIAVTTRYLAEQIEEHFASEVAGVKVKCVKENVPLGTIGSASLVDLPEKGCTIVMNSDLLTTISFEELYLKHHESNADATIAVIPYQVSVPYAILTLDGDNVSGIAEKPSYSYYANAGIYIFNNNLLRNLPTDCRTDATDLIEQVIASNGRVSYYVINGTWIDVGSPTDFRQAGELMRHYKSVEKI